MTPGQMARRILGSKFRIAGHIYRRIFVNMDKVTNCMISEIPEGANILDIGGGDGYVVNMLLTKRPDVRVTMTDISVNVGSFIRREYQNRVTILQGTELSLVDGKYDVFTIADVIHHVPKSVRTAFLSTIADTARRTGCKKIIVKDIQPGNFRAVLSLWSDIYITGDKGVSLVKLEDIALPGFKRVASQTPDYPNYCLTFST